MAVKRKCIMCVFTILIVATAVHIVHVVFTNQSQFVSWRRQQFVGGLINILDKSTVSPVSKSSALNTDTLQAMTDVLRPYFRDRKEGNNSQLAIYSYSAFIRESDGKYQKEIRSKTGYNFSYAIHFSSWEYRRHFKEKLKCCNLWMDGYISEVADPKRIYPTVPSHTKTFMAVHYTCPINEPEQLKGSYLVSREHRCSDFRQRIIKPQVALPAKEGSIGVCLKILYGDVNPKLLVDWMEYYREMKVDTVVTKTFNINKDVQNVVENYVNEGFLTTSPFHFPWQRDEKTFPSGLVHERVAMLDCQEKLKNHTYLTMLDLDEFLYPYQSTDFKEMLANLTASYPKEYGFRFKSEMFVKEWGESGTSNGSDIVRYFQRLAPTRDRNKYIAISAAVDDGQLRSHWFNMKSHYKPVEVRTDFAAIKHYRHSCYSDQNCTGRRYNDTSILAVVRKIEDRSSRVLSRLAIY